MTERGIELLGRVITLVGVVIVPIVLTITISLGVGWAALVTFIALVLAVRAVQIVRRNGGTS